MTTPPRGRRLQTTTEAILHHLLHLGPGTHYIKARRICKDIGYNNNRVGIGLGYLSRHTPTLRGKTLHVEPYSRSNGSVTFRVTITLLQDP